MSLHLKSILILSFQGYNIVGIRGIIIAVDEIPYELMFQSACQHL